MSSGNWLVITPSGAVFKIHGTLHRLWLVTIISDTFGINAIVPITWDIIQYEYQEEENRIVKVK